PARPLETGVPPHAGDEQRERDLDDVVEGAQERDRGRARGSLAHVHLHLHEPKAAPQRDEGRLHLRGVVWVLGSAELAAGAIERDEARGRVGHTLPAEHRDETREDSNPHAARERGPVAAARVDEPRADHEVCLTLLDWSEDLGYL